MKSMEPFQWPIRGVRMAHEGGRPRRRGGKPCSLDAAIAGMKCVDINVDYCLSPVCKRSFDLCDGIRGSVAVTATYPVASKTVTLVSYMSYSFASPILCSTQSRNELWRPRWPSSYIQTYSA